ncbi:uncharacterized protein LOC117294998 [Asterias rubens]|uniref:uncharacterized protein LOC117294998 n=1 Tax=Asterias rubens TaxID=7604 RepID=UPI0014554277|nr:uncharacterized protein LOC117294998 [Asterias rubens]
MTDTYHLQRKDICSGMPIVELNKEWPFLLTCKCLVNHFHMLTEINLQSAMEVSLHARNKGCRIYEYVLSGPQKKKSGDLKQWIRIIKAEVEETKSTDPQCQGVSFLLLHYFEEEEDRLFRFYGVDGNKQKIDSDKLKPPSPFIAIIGSREDMFQGQNLFYLVVEGSVVNDRIATFSEAVISLFSCFYTLSLEYPPEAAVTMEFIQRELIGINPEGPVGAKNGGKKKKKSIVAPKIVALLRGIMEFESDWHTDQ